MKISLLLLTFICSCFTCATAQSSIAREWNEVNLDAVRLDVAQPTLTARNLWHTSAAMYDAWAVYDLNSETYFLGKEVGEFYVPFNGISVPTDETELIEAREETISYAAYRILSHRYAPDYVPEESQEAIQTLFDDLMNSLGYDISFTSTDFAAQNPDQLGTSFQEQLLKDYNGQTYWLSVNLKSFFKQSPLPKWFNLALGYGGEGLLSGLPSTSTQFINAPERYRQYYLSFDIDLQRIPTNSPFLKTVFNVFNAIKVPFPALEFSRNGLVFRPLR